MDSAEPNSLFPPLARVFFLGIGGVGMCALAQYFLRRGYVVGGYDRTESALTRALDALGVPIVYEDAPEALEGYTHVVYTPAVKEDTRLLVEARRRGLPMLKRAEALGKIVNDRQVLAIAGTHGKTTTAAMLAWLLQVAGAQPSAFIGGVANNFAGVYVEGDSDLVVVEADEFDRSFLHLTPNALVVTALDPDHLDVYGTPQEMTAAYRALVRQTKPNGLVVPHEKIRRALEIHPDAGYIIRTYGPSSYQNVRYEELTTVFDFVSEKGKITNLRLRLPGLHNVENMCAALTVCLSLGLSPEKLAEAVESFTGVKRRFEIRFHSPTFTLIDDYAHHPAEIEAAIRAAHALFPKRKIVVAFQPHLYSRTRDFYKEFAAALSLADVLFLMHIYPAREKPMDNITSKIIYDATPVSLPKRLITLETFSEAVAPDLVAPCVLLTLGAGDIDKVIPDVLNKYAR